MQSAAPPTMKRKATGDISCNRDSRLWIGALAHTWHSNHSPTCQLYKHGREKRQRKAVQVSVQEPVAVTVEDPVLLVEADDDEADIVHIVHSVNSICQYIEADLERLEEEIAA
jgi:hypothetical protein